MTVPARTALVVAPQGIVVEQLAGNAVDRALRELAGTAVAETRLADVLDAIDAAADDDRVEALLLNLDGMLGAAPSKLQDLAAALTAFRATGKPVVATADAYTRSRYYLAAHADEVFLHPMGMAVLEGYSVHRMFYKNGIDRYEVEPNVFRVGEYKSAVEPYLRNGMSPAAKEANLDWMGDLWQAYLDEVAAVRDRPRADLQSYVEDYVDLLGAAGGDAAGLAQDAGLVDHLGDSGGGAGAHDRVGRQGRWPGQLSAHRGFWVPPSARPARRRDRWRRGGRDRCEGYDSAREPATGRDRWRVHGVVDS